MGIVYAMLVLGVFSSDARADVSAGASKAQICLTCHQAQHRLAAIPLLEGQPAEYLYVQLKAYKDKTRADPTATMPSSAANLTDLDMREISSFLATQTAPTVAYQVDSAKAALGQNKAAGVRLRLVSHNRPKRRYRSASPRGAGGWLLDGATPGICHWDTGTWCWLAGGARCLSDQR